MVCHVLQETRVTTWRWRERLHICQQSKLKPVAFWGGWTSTHATGEWAREATNHIDDDDDDETPGYLPNGYRLRKGKFWPQIVYVNILKRRRKIKNASSSWCACLLFLAGLYRCCVSRILNTHSFVCVCVFPLSAASSVILCQQMTMKMRVSLFLFCLDFMAKSIYRFVIKDSESRKLRKLSPYLRVKLRQISVAIKWVAIKYQFCHNCFI